MTKDMRGRRNLRLEDNPALDQIGTPSIPFQNEENEESNHKDNRKNKNKLPEVLSIDGIEAGEKKSLWVFGTFDNVYTAKMAARAMNGVLYTQVDSEESDDRIYVKGERLVNRTGTWAVVVPVRHQ